MNIRRPRLGLATLVIGLLVAPVAYGQSINDSILESIGYENRGYGEPLVPKGIGLDRSSVGYETIRQAANTNAEVYGAIGAFDRYLRPTLDGFLRGEESDSDDDIFVFALDHYQSYGVGRAIGMCSPDPVYPQDVCDGQPRVYTADLYSTSIAAAWGDSKSGFFGSASYSLAMIPPVAGGDDRAASRGVFAFYLGLLTFAGMPAYRLLGKKVFNFLMPGSADGILGGYTTLGPIRGYGGYVLSRGAFGDLAIPRYSPFATAALSQDFGSLALVRGGLRDMDLAETLGLPDDSGFTSLFAQRTLLPVPRVDPGGASLDDLSRELVQVPFVTAHLRQMDLVKYVDLKLALGSAPEVFVHEALIAFHSESFSRRRAAPTDSEMQSGVNEGFGWSLSAGTASLPPMYYYAVQGGNRFSFKAEAAYGPFSAFVRMNDPEFLQAFPFAYNAVNGGIAVGLSED